MNDLDPRALEAASNEAHELFSGLLEPENERAYAAAIVSDYLDATRTARALSDLQRMGQECEGEVDRIAVVCDSTGYGQAMLVEPGYDVHPGDWNDLEIVARDGGHGPFRRQIVHVHLLRPEPVAEVAGRVTP